MNPKTARALIDLRITQLKIQNAAYEQCDYRTFPICAMPESHLLARAIIALKDTPDIERLTRRIDELEERNAELADDFPTQHDLF